MIYSFLPCLWSLSHALSMSSPIAQAISDLNWEAILSIWDSMHSLGLPIRCTVTFDP